MACDVVLFDFFGTLVRYSPSWTAQGFSRSHEVLRSLGCDLNYGAFLNRWSALMEGFEERAEASGREFSMDEVVDTFLHDVLGTGHPDHVHLFRDTYVAEWCTAVRPIPGLPKLIGELARSHTVAVVTNTHDRDLVPRLLDAHGLATYISTAVLSVKVGIRKPCAGIFQEAVDRLGVEPSRCLFVGDSYVPDYVGPTNFGMEALLIDPERLADVPADRRITSVLDVTDRLAIEGGSITRRARGGWGPRWAPGRWRGSR